MEHGLLLFGLMRLLTFLINLLSWTVSIAAARTIDGLYVNTFGDSKNQAVVVIHGGPGYNSFSFEATTAQQLADQGFYVIAYDQRGSGRISAARSQLDFTYKSQILDLKEIVDSLAIRNPILIGHSFGGSLALSYLDTYPKSVREVVLVAAPVSMPQTFRAIVDRATRINLQPTWDPAEYQKKISNLAQIRQVSDAMFGPFPIYGLHANGKRFIPPQIIGIAFSQAMSNGTYDVQQPSEEKKAIDESLKASVDKKWLDDMKAEPMFGFAQNENYATFDFFDIVRKHRDRVFGIYGAEDGLFDQTQLEQIRTALPVGHFRTVPGASHAVFHHQRSVFVERVRSYCKR